MFYPKDKRKGVSKRHPYFFEEMYIRILHTLLHSGPLTLRKNCITLRCTTSLTQPGQVLNKMKASQT